MTTGPHVQLGKGDSPGRLVCIGCRYLSLEGEGEDTSYWCEHPTRTIHMGFIGFTPETPNDKKDKCPVLVLREEAYG